MNRLTERDKSLTESSAFENLDAFDMIDWQEMIYDKLQKYENFMEEKEIDNLAELCYCIETRGKIFAINGELNQQIKRQQKENQALKDRWAELKDWVNARYNDYRFEGHIVSPETEELDAITNKMQKLEEEN